MRSLLRLSHCAGREPLGATFGKSTANSRRAPGRFRRLPGLMIRRHQTKLPEYHSREGRVLSIQSHVVHGYVGNKSAVFPLQLLGLDVDPVNSVQFSNHTGYEYFAGERLNGSQLWDLVTGLERNNLTEYTHLLTGYIGSDSFLRTVIKTYELLKRKSPDVVYFCDPVMGDGGRLYVPEALVKIYRDEIVPIATVITPNQFEAELLTERKIKTEADVEEVVRLLHAKGPRTVILTSLELESTPKDQILIWGSYVRASSAELDQYKLTLPRLPGGFTGTGDLMAALLLAWTYRHPMDLALALERAAATMQAVLRRTNEIQSPRAELRLVQSKKDIETPEVIHRAQPIKRRLLGVMFDMDGTLTHPGTLDFNKIRREFNLKNTGNILFDIETAEESVRAAALQAVEDEEARGIELMKIRAQTAQLLMWLQSHGVRVGLATRNSYPAVEQFLAKLGLDVEVFDPVITRDFPFVKPDPGVIRSASDYWQIQPSNILMVGDHRDDILCGQNAGSLTCLITEEEAHGMKDVADFSISCLSELDKLLLPLLAQSEERGEITA